MVNIRIVLIFILVLNLGCRYPKCTEKFKVAKKTLNTYVLLDPVVSIYARVKNAVTSNPPLSSSTSKIIDGVVNTTLSSKFNLKKIAGLKFRPSELDSLYKQMDYNKSKQLSGIAITSVLNRDFIGQPEKYGLLVSLKGYYNPNYSPHNSLASGMAGNSLILYSNTKPLVYVRLLVIDFEINEVVYYDKYVTENYDPRLESEMAELIKSRIRKIYYR
jgi:hypothetical protein